MNRYAYQSPLLRAVAQVVDAAGRLVFRRKGGAVRDVRRVVLFRLDQIGDAFYCTPILDHLRATHPDVRVDVVTTERCAPVFQGHPALGEVRVFNYARFARGGKADGVSRIFSLARELRRARYDVAVDPRGEPLVALLALFSGARVRVGLAGEEVLSSTYTHPVRYAPDAPAWHRFRSILEVLGAEAGSWEPRIVLGESERDGARRRAEELGPFLALHLGAGVPFKRWPLESFAEVAAARERGLRVVAVGGPDETELAASLGGSVENLCGKLSVRETYALLGHAAGFVGNDSAPVHLAGAQGVPTVHLMSAASPASASALGPRVVVLRGENPAHACPTETCPYPCPHLAAITPQEVVAALSGVLS